MKVCLKPVVEMTGRKYSPKQWAFSLKNRNPKLSTQKIVNAIAKKGLRCSKASVARWLRSEGEKKAKKKPGARKKDYPGFAARLIKNIDKLNTKGRQVTSTSIRQMMKVPFCDTKLRKMLRVHKVKYKNIRSEIVLSETHRRERLLAVYNWALGGINFFDVIFTDEKRFSVDGPDSRRSWVANVSPPKRNKRQQLGGSLHVFGWVSGYGVLGLYVIEETLNAVNYVKLLDESVLPDVRLMHGDDFVWQQDGAPAHTAKYTKDYLQHENINVLKWPSRSPDLNILENIWKMLQDRVYNGFRPSNVYELWERILFCANQITVDQIRGLYDSVANRCEKVVKSMGHTI